MECEVGRGPAPVDTLSEGPSVPSLLDSNYPDWASFGGVPNSTIGVVYLS